MCDIRTFNRIEKAVEMKMAARQMFTAFDITLALQKNRARKTHREIRREIKKVADNLMWRFGYERTIVDFREVNASAFVYHPFGTDARLHRTSIRPHSLGPASSQRFIPFAKPVVRSKVDQHQQNSSSLPADIAQALDLSMAGLIGVVVDVVSGLFIIIK